jgi:hypothetical protein
VPALVAVLVAIAAAASAEPLHLSAPPLESRAAGAAVAAVTGVVLGLAVAGAVALLALLVSGRRGRSDPERRRAPAGIPLRAGDALAFALVLGVAVGALVAVLALSPRDRSEIEPTRSLPLIGRGASEVTQHDSGWLAASVLLVLGAAVVLTVLMFRAGRRPAAAAERAPGPSSVAAPSREPLVWAADPRTAVLQAYALGEATLADRGLGRAETETPREYLSRVGGTPLRTLTSGYEAARFGHHAIGTEARRAAIDAAERLERAGT